MRNEKLQLTDEALRWQQQDAIHRVLETLGICRNHLNEISTVEDLKLILSVGINVLDEVGWGVPAESMDIAASHFIPSQEDETTPSAHYLYAAVANGIREANE